MKKIWLSSVIGVPSVSILISNCQFLSLFKDVCEVLKETGKKLKVGADLGI